MGSACLPPPDVRVATELFTGSIATLHIPTTGIRWKTRTLRRNCESNAMETTEGIPLCVCALCRRTGCGAAHRLSNHSGNWHRDAARELACASDEAFASGTARPSPRAPCLAYLPGF